MKTADNTCVIHFLISISILFTSSTSFSSDLFSLGLRKNIDGTFSNTERLVCQSPASALEELNHSLYIPTCNSEKSELKILSEHLPVSAIFVSCRPDTIESCSNIIKSVLLNKTGATVNVLINVGTLTSGMMRSLGELKIISLKSNSPLNIIPLNTSVPIYIRDSGLFMQGNEGDISYTANSYKLDKVIGDAATSELSEKCGYRFDKMTTKNKPGAANRSIKFSIDYEGGDSSLFGGNFMALPTGTLVVGENDRQSPDSELLTYFQNKQKVIKLKIPKLAVGHIDEIFRIIPAHNSCGFSILYASPKEMKIFLQERPKKEIISRASSALGSNETVDSLLKNKVVMRTWEKNENLIRKSAELLIKDIHENMPSKCLPMIVPLPVYWDTIGEPLIPNPVNALTINGKYFYSKASREYYGSITKSQKNSLPYKIKEENVEYTAFDQYVKNKLAPFFGENIYPVATDTYNKGLGNFHCATANIILPCKQ